MASHSYSDECPNCGEQLNACADTRTGLHEWCPHCGYTMVPVISQCSLEELNERREQEHEMNEEKTPFVPLTELPKWNLHNIEEIT